jgi:hypothetical protein
MGADMNLTDEERQIYLRRFARATESSRGFVQAINTFIQYRVYKVDGHRSGALLSDDELVRAVCELEALTDILARLLQTSG